MRVSLIAAVVLGLFTWPSAAAAQIVPVNQIVVLRDGVDAGQVAAQHAAQLGLRVSHVYTSALRGYAAPIPAAGVALLRRDPRVAFVAADPPVRLFAQTLPTGVNRVDAEQSSHAASNAWPNGPAVAVIDTGSGPHADVNVVGGFDCTLGLSYNDDHGHGTHVAGSIGAVNNGEGVVGVAPGVPIYSVKVLTLTGVGLTSHIVCGIDWVTANAASKGIKVASMSLGGGGADDGNCGNTNQDAMHRAICGSVAAGVTYVVAAGNDGVDFKDTVPASYDEVLTVSAMSDSNGAPGGGGGAPSCRAGEPDDGAASFSNFATPSSADAGHTIAGPGVCIYSTHLLNGYSTLSGTSMATPHVSGAAALCLASACAGMSPAQVVAKLRADAQARSAAGTTPYYGFQGDPNRPTPGRHYGYLMHAGAY